MRCKPRRRCFAFCVRAFVKLRGCQLERISWWFIAFAKVTFSRYFPTAPLPTDFDYKSSNFLMQGQRRRITLSLVSFQLHFLCCLSVSSFVLLSFRLTFSSTRGYWLFFFLKNTVIDDSVCQNNLNTCNFWKYFFTFVTF